MGSRVNRRERDPIDPRTAAKLGITAVFLPCIAYLIIFGSRTSEGGMVGLGIAMVGVLGAFWGPPGKSGGPDA